VAYRQLRSVTFALLGLVAFACGGNTTAATGTGSTPAGEQPPANPDQAPNGADQAAASSDTPPPNPDGPPASADAPAGSGAGGTLQAVCQQLCSSISQVVDQCSQGVAKLGVGDLCSSSCDIPPTVVPCASELASLLQCFIGSLDNLCAGVQSEAQGSAPAPRPDATQCDAATKAAQDCADANHIDLSSDMGMNMPPNVPDPTDACGKLTNACSKCTCQAGTDTAKLTTCFNTACANP
jgi:hypothetical protein